MARRDLLLTLAALLMAPLLLGKLPRAPWREKGPRIAPPGASVKRRG